MRKYIAATAVAIPLFSAPAFAVGLDFSTLTAAVDASSIVSGILAVGAILMLPRLARMGVNWLKGSVK